MPRPWAYADNIEETPFLKLLEDYMYSQRPPITAAQLSYKTKIPSTTIIGWFREGRVPQPRTLQRIAAGTTIPLADLFTACGYPVPASVESGPADPFEAMIERALHDPRFSSAAREALVARIREVQSGALAAPGERYIAAEHEQVVEGTTSPAHPAIQPPATPRSRPGARPRTRTEAR
ncbi:MAG TPA: hypothetical protein VFU72_08855 [Nitrolancea sp.]|nr:hypothetical protein [Nitrolancea sp.]